MYLMCKNIVLAQIDFDKNLFDVFRPDLMPLGLRGNNVNLFTVYDWFSNRVLHLSRSNAKTIISSLGLQQGNRVQICFACKALSLTDCYWLKLEDDNSTWESVNLYQNSLSSAVAKIALTGEYVSIQGKIRTPELTNDGSYAKCWKRHNGDTYLYKTGSTQGTGKEHLVEVFCSDLLDKLDIEHIPYILTVCDDKPVSRCKNMTDINRSICEMEYFIPYCNRNGINAFKYFKSNIDFFKMLAVDYIMFNSDRHLGNWGVYLDANTGEVLGLHPLYDHNEALDESKDPMSKVIEGKTLEECARWSKRYVKLDTRDLWKWLKKSDTKNRLSKINHKYYKDLIKRLKRYDSW